MDLDLRIARYTLHFTAIDTVLLPAYKGSTLRGAFGYALKSVCCSMRQECAECLLQSVCLFQMAFGSKIPADDETFFSSYSEVPRPFIIEPPTDDKLTYYPGEVLSIGLILMGQAIDQLPYFIAAFRKMGENGIGKGRGRLLLTLTLLTDDAERIVYDGVRFSRCQASFSLKELLEKVWSLYAEWDRTDLTITIDTPLRLREKGHLLTHLDAVDFIKNIVRRSSGLSSFYGRGGLTREMVHSLLELASEISTECAELYWYDWNRVSAQNGPMKMGGLKGRVYFRNVPTGLIPWIVAGEILHVGKGATFGLGKYRITSIKG